MNVHLVLFAQGSLFTKNAERIIETIQGQTAHNIIIHNYNLESISQKEWFSEILSNLLIRKKCLKTGNDSNPYSYSNGMRGTWKPFITKEVYDKMASDDILYYMDSSRYFDGIITEDIDLACSQALKNKCIAGILTEYQAPGQKRILTNRKVGMMEGLSPQKLLNIWSTVFPGVDASALDKYHILASSYIFTKTPTNTLFINDYAYYTTYMDEEHEKPLVSYMNLTVDQTIFNILVHKYNRTVFYTSDHSHRESKNHNCMLNILNNTQNIKQHFIKLNTDHDMSY